MVSFQATIAALADTIIRELCGEASKSGTASPDSVTRFLLDLHGGMPDYLRLPFKCLTLLFGAWPILYAGRPFHRLPHERRWQQIRAWKRSRLGVRRDLIKFFETLTVFSLYSDVYQQDNSTVAGASRTQVFEHGERSRSQ